MSTRSNTLTGTPADLLAYQNELVRTKNYTSLGRMNKIIIGPSNDWAPPPVGQDPFIDKFGRDIDLRSRMIPIAMSPDRSILLVTAPFMAKSRETGEFLVGLPDVPAPDWKAPAWTAEETGYRTDGSPLNKDFPGQPEGWTPKHGRSGVSRDAAKDIAPMLPQRLEDRAERPGGRLGVLEGTNFLVFQPVLQIVYQPEVITDGKPQLQAALWMIMCLADTAEVPARHPALLVDPRTGEAHFFGGRYDIIPTE